MIPFYKILNEIHQDTALYRRQDNKNFCFLSDYRKRLSRTKNFHKKQNIPKISQEKRQLLIENAFKRVYKKTSLSQEQGIDLCNNDQICPYFLAPSPHLYSFIKFDPSILCYILVVYRNIFMFFCLSPSLPPLSQSSHLNPL